MKEEYYLPGGYRAVIDRTHRWNRTDFAYLGLVTPAYAPNRPFAWAWHEDGRSIDRDDRSFDIQLKDNREAPYSFWLGKEAA